MYNTQVWVNHVTDQDTGEVIQYGTLQDQEHFDHMEEGIADATLAGKLMMMILEQQGQNNESELHVLELSMNNSPWPFNNKENLVALDTLRESINYEVHVDVLKYSGGRLGNIRVTSRALNGFKLLHDGSATTVKAAVRVSGGMTDPKLDANEAE